MDTKPEAKKIERTCPRCRTHAYHWLRRYMRDYIGRVMRGYWYYEASCVNCGHAWHCRPKKDEL